jgi:DNA-binding MarR family transcriptional regulator
MARRSLEILRLGRMLHDPTRLLILTFLYHVAALDYVSLRKKLKFSTGNLSWQLRKLERAGYLAIEKRFKGRRPQTICGMTKKGREALEMYAEMLKEIRKGTEGAKED